MAERDSNNGWVQEFPPVSEKPISEYLGTFFNDPLIREILQEQDAKWVVKPTAKPELDVAFFPKGGRGESLASVSFMGGHLSVGIRLVEGNTKEEIKESMEKILQEPAIQHIYNSGFRVIFATPTDFPLWEKFYTVASSKGLIKQYGRRVHELAGIERASPLYGERMSKRFQDLLIRTEEEKELKTLGIEHIGPYTPIGFDEYSLDYAFLSKGQPTVIPMTHVRESYEGDLVREKVIPGKVLVPGVISREVGESKQEAYGRARVAEAFYREKLGIEAELKIPILSAGQVSLWEKLGTFQYARPAVSFDIDHPGTEIPLRPDDLIQYLFLGKSSLDRGELARAGLSLPTRPELPGVDVLFLSRNPITLARDFTVLSNPIYGLDLAKHDEGKFELKLFHNVAGLVLVPEYWDKSEIKNLVESTEAFIKNHLGLGLARILPVTPSLFNHWQKPGNTVLGGDPSPIQRRYGNVEIPTAYPIRASGPEGQVFVAKVRPGDSVGGNTSFIAEVIDGKVKVHAFDLGAEFNFEPAALRALTSTPATSLGILPSLESGQTPMLPGFHETEYLIAAAQNNPALLHDQKNPVYRYILAELYARLETEKGRYEEAGLPVDEIIRLGKPAHEVWYRAGDWHLNNVILSHLHWDHSGVLGTITSEAKIIAPNEQLAIMRAMTASARLWSQKFGHVSLITQPKNGSAYQRIERVTQPYKYGERIPIGSGLYYTGEASSHSIPSQMQYFEVEGGKSFINTGDIRVGDEWPLTEETVSKLAGKGDVIFLETTNPPGTEKISAGVTEATVRGNLERVFRDHPSSVMVVVAPKNHTQRITSIIEAAENVGRKVALSPKHAAITNQISFDQALSDEDIRSFPYALPILGEDVALWLRPYSRLSSYEKALKNISGRGVLGVVDTERLSEENDKWVVVMSPWDLLQKSFPKMYAKHGVTYVWSSYYTYDQASKDNLSSNFYWLKERNNKEEGKFNFYGDLEPSRGGKGHEVTPKLHDKGPFHASGHATFEQLFDKVLVPLLDGKYKDKTVILVHGSEPGLYSSSLRKELIEYEDKRLRETAFWAKKRLGLRNPEDLKIIWQLDRYNPNRPLDSKSPLGMRIFTHQLR